MSARAFVDPPYLIMDVLNAVTGSMDQRFRQVPNGRVEIAWRQARKTKGEESPPRYFVAFEFTFDPKRGGESG